MIKTDTEFGVMMAKREFVEFAEELMIKTVTCEIKLKRIKNEQRME